ncbi:hypothetical protein FHR20_000004 [Sphingomonas leidyi]|uniref:Uncharacterized protein n=1 Tax=Sphingomonas leidyi TaxID=68569 RepID=A0A7X5ZU66_9SPHN|nr:hypothetical protein [Sphingomonas leidyi]NIJ63073.1 hypothetical protein [Sphingomonas leidyi]
MSRAVNIDATVEQVVAMSAKHDAAISTIEALVPLGTRVVFVRAEDARAIERIYGTRLLKGAVTRTPVRPRRAN